MHSALTTLGHHPNYAGVLAQLHRQAAPGFLRHAQDYYWGELSEGFDDFQFLMLSGNNLIGAALSLPLHWSGAVDSLPATMGDILIRAIDCRDLKTPANTLAVLAVITTERCRDNGVRSEILTALKDLAGERGLTSLVVPVRPDRKSDYPLTPFSQYMQWAHVDGSPFDPELRMHWELGAMVLGSMPEAVMVEASVGAWERWTGMHFKESGEYIVDGALKPVIIDRASDCGYYTDSKVWMYFVIPGTIR